MGWGEAMGDRTPRTAEQERWWRIGAEDEARARRFRSTRLGELAGVLEALDTWDDVTDDRRLAVVRAIYFPTWRDRARHRWGRAIRRRRAVRGP